MELRIPFWWLTNCKSIVELAGQQKLVERMVVEETIAEGLIVEGILIEKLTYEKEVIKG